MVKKRLLKTVNKTKDFAKIKVAQFL